MSATMPLNDFHGMQRPTVRSVPLAGEIAHVDCNLPPEPFKANCNS